MTRQTELDAKRQVLGIATLLAALGPAAAPQQSKYPPIGEHLTGTPFRASTTV